MNPRYIHYLKVAIKFTLATAWIGAICAVSLTFYHSYFTPASTIDVDALEQRITLTLQQERDNMLTNLSGLETKIESLQQMIDDTNAALDDVKLTQQSHILSINELTLDKTKMKTLEARLSAAEKRLNEPRKTGRTSTPKKAAPKRVVPKVTVAPPPFVLFDIQKRGAVSLAIVGRPDAKRLSDLSAVRQGERYLGWHLVDVEGDQVRVRNRAGQEVQLEVEA